MLFFRFFPSAYTFINYAETVTYNMHVMVRLFH